MKKTLALLLALAMVFSTVTVAFAEEAIGADAQACVTLGMLQGDGNGVDAVYLAKAPSRLQAAIMFLRLKGLEDEALAYTGTENFVDVDQVNWAGGKAILGYLKTNPELGWIGNNGNFDPSKTIEAQEYYKVMLEALGYKQNTTEVIGDFTWEGVVEFAASVGLLKVAAVTDFTNNDIAIATVEALKANVKGTEKTLAASLVEANVITEEAAVAAGVYTAPVAELEVVSVEAINLKETVVTFNTEVDEDTAEDTDNYLLDDEDIDASAALNDDKKSVTITWDASYELDNQTEYDLTVDGVVAVSGAELEEVTVTFTANDVTTPVAESLTLVGPNKMKLVFSEPIAVEGDVAIEDADFDYEVAEINADGNEVTIELSDDELEEGDYTVEVTAFEDYAGLKNLKKTFTLAYEKDTTAPVATIKSASQTKVVVEFNKPVYNGESGNAQPLDENFFYHTYTSYEPVLVVPSSDFEEYEVYFTVKAANEGEDLTGTPGELDEDLFTDRPLAEGNVKFVVIADGDDVITDEWGNEVEDNMTFTVAIDADVTAPAVTKIDVVDQNNVDVYFSEDVAISSSDDPSDYFTLVNEDGDDVDIDDLAYSNADDDYIATLTFNGGNELEGDYTLTVVDVVDLALEENEIAKTTEKFTVADETAPDLTTIAEANGIDQNDTDDSDYVYVAFPEDMATSGEYSVLNKDNYQIVTGAGTALDPYVYHDLVADDKIATFNGSDMVKITIDDSTDYVINNAKIIIYRVADALGNKAEDFGFLYPINPENSPVITAVKTLDEKLIEITIDAELKSVNKAYITVQHGLASGDLYAIKSWDINDDNETVITGVLPSTLKLTSPADKNIVVSIDGNKFETILGTDMLADTFMGTVDDGYAPSITDDDDITGVVGSGVFTINFDEALATANQGLYAQDLVVKNSDGDVLVAGIDYVTTVVDYTYDSDGDDIADTTMTNGQLRVALQNTTKANVDGDYKVYSNSTIKYITDVEGNEANAFTTSVTIDDLR